MEVGSLNDDSDASSNTNFSSSSSRTPLDVRISSMLARMGRSFSGGGAGSVVETVQAGIPQVVSFGGQQATDKNNNSRRIEKFKLGVGEATKLLEKKRKNCRR